MPARVMQEGEGALRTVQDQHPLGINAAVRGAGLPEDAERRCEMNTGLLLALDQPQALERWVSGDDILEPARAAVSYAD